MNSLIQFYIYQAKRSQVMIILLLVLPVLIPFIIYGIMLLFTNSVSNIKIRKFEVPNLPPVEQITSPPEHLVYFSYSPDEPRYKDFIDQMFQMNGISGRSRAFKDATEAERYINIKNIVPGSKQRFDNVSFYSKILCDDFRLYSDAKNLNYQGDCLVDLSKDYEKVMLEQYKLTSSDLQIDVSQPEYQDNILFHINFLESATLLQGVPSNVTYEIVYNTTILDATMKLFPDPLLQKYGSKDNAYWTGYSYTLQNQLNQITLKRFTDLDLQISNKRFDELSTIKINANMLFEVSVALAWSVLLVVATQLAASNKGPTQIILRRVGIREYKLFLVNFAYVFFPVMASCFIMAAVWHHFGVMPFSCVTLGFSCFAMFLVGLIVCAVSTFLSTFLSQHTSAAIVCSCLFAFFLIILPAMLHTLAFGGRTIFDPSLMPQPLIFAFLAVLPPFSSVSVLDSMTSSMNETLRDVKFSAYEWKLQNQTVPIKYLFTNYQNYTSTQRNCLSQKSKFGQMVNGMCTYKQPLYESVVILVFVQFSVIVLLSLFGSYAATQKGFRCLGLFFMFKRSFWRKIKHLKPGKANVRLRSFSLAYNQKLFSKKSSVKLKAFGRKKFVINKIDYTQDEGVVAALVAESGGGKSTTLAYFAGELHQTDLHSYVQRKAKRNKIDLSGVQKSENLYEDYQKATDLPSLLKCLSQVEKIEAVLFDTFDITDPVDAYLAKPYIGYQPQDHSNVWPKMTCFQNVFFSYILRMEAQGVRYSKKEAKAKVLDVLRQMDLFDSAPKQAHKLSGGMLRRLALCNVVVGEPKLLLLDELSAGVDPVLKRKIWKCIEEINRRTKTSIILSTHDTSEIQEMAQRITILHNGFTLVDNQTPFDLRHATKLYSVKFYSELPTCCQKTADEMKREFEGLESVKDAIQIDTISPHGIHFIVNKSLSGGEQIELCAFVNKLKTQFGMQDSILQKAKLDDVYMDTIKHPRHQNIYDDQKVVTQKERVNPARKRVKGLFVKSIWCDFKKIPLPIILGLGAVLFAVIVQLFSTLIIQLNDLMLETTLLKGRTQDLASKCFESCEIKNPQDIEKCFRDRYILLFQNIDQQSWRSNVCGWYSNYLGIDVSQQSYISIGDYRNNNYESINYHYSFTHQQNATSHLGITSAIKNKTNGGILPYIIPKVITRFGYSNDCQTFQLCVGTCDIAKIKCHNMDINKCHQPCYSQPLDWQKYWNLAYYNTTSIFKDEISVLDNYKKSLEQNIKFTNYQQYLDQNYIELGQISGQNQNIVNFNFIQLENELINNKLSGNIELEISQPVPNRGSTESNYQMNKLTYNILENREIACDGTITQKHGFKQTYRIPSMKKQHESSKMNSKELQSLPDREHVTLFDVQNEPFTQLIGGIIRKQIFLNSPVGDQSPWRFSYSLTSRTMPYLGDPEISADAGSAVLEYASSLKLAQIVVSGLMPMLFAALKFGNEIELNTLKLLNLHTVSGLQWIMNSWMYFAFCAVITVVLNLCGELIFLPEILSQRVNIVYHFIQALESICTGMLIAAVAKRGKPASITSFLLILFVMIFIILNFGGKAFAFILGVILPAFTCSYLTQLSQKHEPISVSVLIFGLVFSGLQMLLVFRLVEKDKIMNQNKVQKIKQNQSDNKQSQEVQNQLEKVYSENISTQSQTSVKTCGTDLEPIIMQSTIAPQTPVIASPDMIQDSETVGNLGLQLQNVHHKYNNSTYAVQGASMDIQHNQIFGLLGSNGSGKSTLMHCMAGMFKPQQGQALVPDNGQVVDLFQLKNSTRYFSVVPQHDVFWPNLTISQHLQLMQLYNAMEVDVELLLKELKLTEFKNQTAQTLSGGQKRRLSIAMAMTMQPKVLAFDEPSCGLGVTTKRFVHQAILNVLSKDTTLLLTTHDMEEVEALVDQCCIMHLGKVLKIGSVAQMCAQQKFDLKIRGNDALVQVLVEELRCEYPAKNAVCDFWCFSVTNMGQLQIMNVLNSHGLLESEWIVEAAKMEQIFMEVVDSAQ
ncbi:ABC_transporter family protein [Hexamita inflata]|uniref:ABC transporter family protein n=1 Tax=Hexamita inflata TaxID=28002 RepID=A0AA86NUN9_9EUKA|nr:ABC transporter family protein [Hexamita inflata]CAI9965688.1 ABC transporter family protein [Hexamita inflata]